MFKDEHFAQGLKDKLARKNAEVVVTFPAVVLGVKLAEGASPAVVLVENAALDLLEEQLVAYAGTLILVSHDRDFLDHVTTSTFVFETGGRIGEYTGGYSDWRKLQQTAAEAAPAKARATDKTAPSRKAKLSFNDRRELEALPSRIEELEAEQHALHERMADPVFYQKAGPQITTAKEQLDTLEQDLTAAYARWEELAQLDEA